MTRSTGRSPTGRCEDNDAVMSFDLGFPEIVDAGLWLCIIDLINVANANLCCAGKLFWVEVGEILLFRSLLFQDHEF